MADATKEGIEAGKVAADALIRQAELEKDAAIARLETARLMQIVAWRRVTKEQVSLIKSFLSGQSIEKLSVSTVRKDPEAIVYAREIVEALKASGVDCQGPYTTFDLAVGLAFTNATDKKSKEVLREAFAGAGILVQDSNGDGEIMTQLEIIVGSKPEPVAP